MVVASMPGAALGAPSISSVSPSQLPTTGGAAVHIRGSGFGQPGRLASCRLASATPGTAFTHAGYAGKT
eukprot:COSAG05_NODE_15861_length_359_cov_0.792308_1_plen_68_part_10